MPQDSGAFSVDGSGYAAQVGRFGETTLPVFIPEKKAYDAEIAEGESSVGALS
jgi:hypothetical protein